MLAWNLFANSLARLSTVFSSKAHLIRKVPVSLGLMPLHVVVVELTIYLISMALYVAYLVLVGHPFSLTWIWLPLVIGLLAMLAYGGGIVLGMLDVFLPDVKNVVAILLQFGFWMTPIVYLPEILPPWARQLLWLNPFVLGHRRRARYRTWRSRAGSGGTARYGGACRRADMAGALDEAPPRTRTEGPPLRWEP
ncbi:ABC transporter permease [Cupriavidus basilensis]